MKTLPKIALGTWSWGTGIAGGDTVFGNHLTGDQMTELFAAGMKAGLYLWDTAPVYGMGSSETALGNAMRRFPREDILVSTKFTPQIAEESAKQPVEGMLESSLTRLGVEDIDIYWIHNPHDVEKWTPGLIPLLQDGRVKRVGVSNHNLAQLQRADEILGQAGFAVSAVQNHYSLLYRSSEYAGILDYCRENEITFFSYMVLEQGALGGRYDVSHPMPAGSSRAETYNKSLPQLEKLTRAMSEIASQRAASVAQIAIAWAVSKGTVPIIGATRIKHIEDAAGALNIALSADEMAMLERLADEAGVDTRGAWEERMDKTA
ncbi:aldo/keto reductase [Cronobacter dublinensis]|uniref:aldo/keto reductase n=1 Tax=Cronobacter dublinensis TaxID=413497 RepID=UPI001D71CF3C|nr:aldo/keto reductase [Cronobacter dublinensis subsp. dublinensis]ELY9424893.1 aldo/keto reductase [Cronobacter dublinensis]EGT5671086.1 aldo/keto reductase [Cronobacter dublinensis subsp. dublinensis]EGT5687977.1 aldo/keto reductase [Cronobacter dublinensis subsp. dublinensis]EGT5692012.1 aldo/keto reductase [Cronobacter dublinensis subsp. dublinensis]